MKKIVLALLTLTATVFFTACSNGDYIANPSSSSNNSLNPLHPPAFDWTGTGTMSAVIDGVPWAADTNTTFFIQDTTVYFVEGFTHLTTPAISQAMIVKVTNAYAGNVYDLSSTGYYQNGIWLDSATNGNYWFYSASGNVGQMKLLEEDSLHVKGLFYFQGISPTGKIVNVTKGYFNVKK